jgi:ATP-dependent Clp protease ATP-binding subunit ClpB
MKLYQIYVPDLNAYVKYKVLEPEEIDSFISQLNAKTEKERRRKVLQYVIFNLKTEISQALGLMTRPDAERCVEALYTGCVMLNPGLDIDYWVAIAYSFGADEYDLSTDRNFEELKNILSKVKEKSLKTNKSLDKNSSLTKKISKQKFLGLEHHLKNNLIGQDEAVEAICEALLRSQAGLNDTNRPLGIFMFAGASGVGKTHLARTLHEYLFSDEYPMVRIDCGEFQQKHENQKLIGSPPGYVGHDEGGQLVNQIQKNPNSVVLIDEVEKAHPDIWNTFLRVFDEGIITDGKGEKVDFRNTIIILTTNLGNEKTVDHMIGTGTGFNKNVSYQKSTSVIPVKSMVERNTMDAARKYFRPELLNRIDKIIVFNHLTRSDCERIAELEMRIISEKLNKKGFNIEYNQNVINGLIDAGIDSVKGARGLAQVRRDKIETSLAKTIVNSAIPKGTTFTLDYSDDMFHFTVIKPAKKVKTTKA